MAKIVGLLLFSFPALLWSCPLNRDSILDLIPKNLTGQVVITQNENFIFKENFGFKERYFKTLINDSTVYLSVTQMIDEATRLVENIKTEPKRYVQFSIFGKKEKSILDSRDEKLLKKFAVDSLSFK